MVYWRNQSEIPSRGKSLWIAEDIRGRIISGGLSGKLPSERDLASSYGVNFKTVSKALSLLVEAGLLRRSAPHGTFVNADATSGKDNASSGRDVTLLIKTQGHLFENFAGALIDKLGTDGHHASVYGLNPEMAPSDRMPLVSRALERKPDILVVDTDNFNEDELSLVENGAEKVIHISRRALELGFDTNADFVLSDYWLGAYLATKHLIDSGHSRVLFLTHGVKPVPMTSFRHETHYLMIAGYRDAMAEAGLEECSLIFGERGGESSDTDRERLRALFKSSAPPDSVFASQDNRIVGNAGVLRECGIDLRRDVVGYNNTPWSSEWEVPFTSVSIRERRMAEVIVEHVEGKRSGMTYVKPEIVPRVS